jgi:hypothetical protein
LDEAGLRHPEDRGLSEFLPERTVTWKEAIEIIRALQDHRLKAPSSEVNKVPSIPIDDPASWAKNVLSNSTFGRAYADHGFDVNQPMTRGQAAALIASLTDKVGD